MTRIVRFLPAVCMASLLFVACGDLMPSKQQVGMAARHIGNMPKVTGEAQIQWMGGNGRDVPPGEEKLAYCEIEGFDGGAIARDQGWFRYLVYNADGTLHREIIAEVTDDTPTGVVIDVHAAVARFVGIVTYDSKAGTGCQEGTMASGSSEESGCAGGDEEGGCSDGGDDGGCSGGDDGGCSGGGSHGGGGSAHPPGSDSRVSEVVMAVLEDGGTPGAAGDTITWSWFCGYQTEDHPNAVPAPEIDRSETWPAKLCDKPILEGNIVIHAGKAQ